MMPKKKKEQNKPSFTAEDVASWARSAEGQKVLRNALREADKVVLELREARREGLRELRKRWFEPIGAIS